MPNPSTAGKLPLSRGGMNKTRRHPEVRAKRAPKDDQFPTATLRGSLRGRLRMTDMFIPCRGAVRRPAYAVSPHPSRRAFGPPQDEGGGWRAERRKILWLVPCGTRAPSGAPVRGRFRQRAPLSSKRSDRTPPPVASASSWQGFVVSPGGAPMPPERLVATRPAGAAPHPAFATPRESAPSEGRGDAV